MPYRVEYTWDSKWDRDRRQTNIRLPVLAMLFFTAFVFVTHAFWQEGREVLLQILFPGDPETAIAAFSEFASNLGQGIPLKFAAENFCREILCVGY